MLWWLLRGFREREWAPGGTWVPEQAMPRQGGVTAPGPGISAIPTGMNLFHSSTGVPEAPPGETR